MKTVIGINGALGEIKTRGWDQVEDGNGERSLVDDIDIDPNSDDTTSEYVVDADTVTRLRDGFRAEIIWTISMSSSAIQSPTTASALRRSCSSMGGRMP